MSRSVDLDNIDADDALYLRDRPSLVLEAKLQGVHDIEDRIAEALQPDPEPEVEEDGTNKFVNYDGLNLSDLRKVAESRGLPKEGGKKQLVSVLQAADVNDGNSKTVSREAEGAVDGAAGSDDEGDQE